MIALHDRVIPGTRGKNIDHLFIAPTGVWVVDAKTYVGKVEKRDAGPWWRADFRVYVNGRDRSSVADGMRIQVKAVRAALELDEAANQVELRPVVCFVDSEWGLLQRPFAVSGVAIMYPGALRAELKKRGRMSRPTMERVAKCLELSLPRA